MAFFNRLLDFIEARSAKLAIAALVITTLLVAAALAIVSVSYDNTGWKFTVPPNFKLAFVIAYFIIFVASWFILYLLNAKDATDIYSEVRELLKGTWVVTYQETHGPVSSSIIAPKRASPCEILINPENLKLELVFEIRDNPIFRDADKQRIRDVGFRYNEEGGYTMLYYYTGQRIINANISESIISDDGNISRLFALLDMKKVAEIRKEQFPAMRLPDVPIHQKYFDADMGGVKFRR